MVMAQPDIWWKIVKIVSVHVCYFSFFRFFQFLQFRSVRLSQVTLGYIKLRQFTLEGLDVDLDNIHLSSSVKYNWKVWCWYSYSFQNHYSLQLWFKLYKCANYWQNV